jgi:hypothetical protein
VRSRPSISPRHPSSTARRRRASRSSTFAAQPPSSDWTPLPLLYVLYRTPLDEDNSARTGTQNIDLSVGTNQNASTPTIRQLSIQVSYDDGTIWTKTPVSDTPDGWRAVVHNPSGATGKYVSLRAFAEDTTGRTVDQTVIHAYHLAP